MSFSSLTSLGRQPSWPASFLAGCLFSITLLTAAYWNHFHNSFHFDDSHVIENNLSIRSPLNIPLFFIDATAFSSLPANSTYRPLLSASFTIDYWLAGGLDPFQFHLTQFVLLLVLTAGLVSLFWTIFNQSRSQWWNPYAALFGATLFSVHTANTETVNYLSSRSDLLSTLGVVLAFLTYLHAPRLRNTRLYLIPMVLGALAKPPALMFVPLLFVYILFFEQKISLAQVFSAKGLVSLRATVLETVPAFVVGIVLFLFVEGMNPPAQTYGGASRLDYLITQPFVWAHYLRLFFLPLGLTADSDWRLLEVWYDTRLFLGLLVAALLGWWAWVSSGTLSRRPVAFGILWFFLALLPSSSIFPLAEVMNEHRIFFPFIGLCLAATWWGFVRLEGHLTTQPGRFSVMLFCLLGLPILLAHATGTGLRNRIWHSEESLWQDVVQKSPLNGRAWMNYGLTQMAQGRYQEAARLFAQAQVYLPNYAALETNLGILAEAMGDSEKAQAHFSHSLVLDRNYPESHFFYSRWLVEQGRSAQGIRHLRQCLALSPAHGPAANLLMRILFARGDHQGLMTAVRQTLSQSPGDPAALRFGGGDPGQDEAVAGAEFERGLEHTRVGKNLEAAVAYRRALESEPVAPALRADILNNLGWSLLELGFVEEAAESFRQVLQIRPDYGLARNNLALAESKLDSR